MLAAFCLRLAWGLMASLIFLPTAIVPPRFFRVHFLTALFLLAVAAFFIEAGYKSSLWLVLGIAMVACVTGSILWHLHEAPWGKSAIAAGFIVLTALLALAVPILEPGAGANEWLDVFTSGLVLGSATTAMLMGHSYLIAPAMSMSPLFRLLGLLAFSLMLRLGLAAFGLWQWSAQAPSADPDTEMMVLVSVRWLTGFVGPLVFLWMSFETARIRSTQSATGILYVVVILCFLGELTSQVLLAKLGFIV